ncbi:MAG TPA: hypothetical protein VFA54_05550 [Bryobacterales bacterium]|jgi:hypothetical protein|nr:hypothetical protein [Bryobacterales bacterium]
MSKRSTTGTCNLCGAVFDRTAMGQHLAACKGPAPVPGASRPLTSSFHLVVEASDRDAYWLHVAAPVDAPLSKLDDFLREIWLECCGHVSRFSIDGVEYWSDPDSSSEKSMRAPIGKVMGIGDKVSYEYDFGSTTKLALKVARAFQHPGPAKNVQLLARNEAPQIACNHCQEGGLATQICTECQWAGAGWLCAQCAKKHPCPADSFLPVVNSPRVGVCGFTG